MKENKWIRLLAYVTGMVNQELLLQNEYLAAENRNFARPSARRMALEPYSHIRIEANRRAMDSVRTALPMTEKTTSESEAVPAKIPSTVRRIGPKGLQVIEGNGGRDGTRTCDLLR